MRYDFLVETYRTERVKIASVWSEFRDEDLEVRPRAADGRGRSVREASREEFLRQAPRASREPKTFD